MRITLGLYLIKHVTTLSQDFKSSKTIFLSSRNSITALPPFRSIEELFFTFSFQISSIYFSYDKLSSRNYNRGTIPRKNWWAEAERNRHQDNSKSRVKRERNVWIHQIQGNDPFRAQNFLNWRQKARRGRDDIFLA